MIHFCVRSNTLIKMKYHPNLCGKCTIIYDHICTQIFVCWTAVLPDFNFVENDQIVSKMAFFSEYASNVHIVAL